MMVAVFPNIIQVLSMVSRKCLSQVAHPSYIVFPTSAYTLLLVSPYSNEYQLPSPQTFCELTALFKCAKSEFGSTVPRNMALYWFIPALANSSVGSESGTTDDDGTVHLKSVNARVAFSRVLPYQRYAVSSP
jgi:hypothetical protein